MLGGEAQVAVGRNSVGTVLECLAVDNLPIV